MGNQRPHLNPSARVIANDNQLGGAAVLQEVVQLTGLPEEFVDSELTGLLGTSEASVNNLTLDQLRVVLMNYLETLNEEMTESKSRH